jgi:hypothetical protein
MVVCVGGGRVVCLGGHLSLPARTRCSNVLLQSLYALTHEAWLVEEARVRLAQSQWCLLTAPTLLLYAPSAVCLLWSPPVVPLHGARVVSSLALARFQLESACEHEGQCA